MTSGPNPFASHVNRALGNQPAGGTAGSSAPTWQNTIRLAPGVAPPKPRPSVLAWVGLGVSVVAAFFIGFSLFRALTDVDFTAIDPFRPMADWTGVTLIASVVQVVAFIVALIAIFRDRHRIVPAVSLLINLVGTPIAANLGARRGARLLVAHFTEQVLGASQQLTPEQATKYLSEHTHLLDEYGPFVELLFRWALGQA